MAEIVKSGRFDLERESGTETGIDCYITWETSLISGNKYNMHIEMWGFANVTGVSGGRTCSYTLEINDGVVGSGTKSIYSNQYQIICEYDTEVEANNDGSWSGWITAEFSFTSESMGLYKMSGTVENLIIGSANYCVFYYDNYGDNSTFDLQIGFDDGNICNIIDNYPSRDSLSDTSTFIITGNKNGGNTNVSITATKIIKTDYKFEGWSTDKSATTPMYTTTSSFIVHSDVDLYAVWSSTQTTTYSNNTIGNLPEPTRSSTGGFYNVTLNPNNGDSSTVIQAGSLTEYTFGGWASSATSKTKLDSSKAYTSATTVYAIWTPTTTDKSPIELPNEHELFKKNVIQETYNVNFNPCGGTVNPTSMKANKSKKYSLSGWSTVNGSTLNIVDYSYTPTIKKDHNLYAIWSETETTESITLPPANYPSFTFLGWAENENSSKYFNGEYTPTQDIDLYAIYRPSRTGEPYIFHNGKWRKVIPHLRYENVFNECINNN